MMPSRHSHGREGGFTLLELLVAMGLLAMLLTALQQSLHWIGTGWKRGAAQAMGNESVETASSLLRRLLSQAYPAYRNVDGSPRVDFDGGEQAVAFLAPAPGPAGDAWLARFSLSAPVRSGRSVLVLTWRADQPAGGQDSPVTAGETVLLDGIGALTLAYFHPDRGWQPVWHDQTSLPRLIRIGIGFPPGIQASWPDFVVTPRISVDAACRYDPASRGCRGRP